MKELIPHPFISGIIERFRIIEKKFRSGDTTYQYLTKEILTALGELGQDLGFSVCAEQSKSKFEQADCGEFFFDISWIKNESASKKDNGKRCRDVEAKMQELVLAGEIEWGDAEKGDQKQYEFVLEGFQKLLAVRASVRLLVYEPPNKPTGEGVWDTYRITERLQEHIQSFQQRAPGDTYLLIALNADLTIRDLNIRPRWLEYDVIIVDGDHHAITVDSGKIENGEITSAP